MPPRLLVALPLLTAPAISAGQSGGSAHLYAYSIKDRAFEDGYRRHLLWHQGRQDKLAWFAWYVTDGDRAGTFVDGTFGNTPEEFAARPDPAGDGADFRVTVAPYVTPLGDDGWDVVRSASSVTPLEKREASVALHVYLLEPIDGKSFEGDVGRWKKGRRITLYRSTKDGTGRYLLMVAASGETKSPPNVPLPARIVRAETWRYAPRLSLIPGTPLAR
ncbi:MAG: hypothetical protein ABIQ43_02175 [Sphingomonas sp.]